MPFAALLLLIVGAWLVDSAVQNRKPLQTLTQILRNPSDARTALTSARGTGYATAPRTDAGGSPVTAPSGEASGVLSFARRQIGKPYRWGATGPDAYDCSGLVYAAFKAIGVRVPRTTAGLILVGKRVAQSDLQPGDLVFPDPGHVQIYSGSGNVIEAPRKGEQVREVPMWGFLTARRVLTPSSGPHGSANAAEAYR